MSETPRTDKLFKGFDASDAGYWEAVSHARDLERELAAVTAERDRLKWKCISLEDSESVLIAERDRLLETRNYCMGILHEAGHDKAAPLEALVRRSIKYGNLMEAERDELRRQLAESKVNATLENTPL